MMVRYFLKGIAFLAFASTAGAADLPPVHKTDQAAWTWEGLYFGVHSGALWSNVRVSDPFGSSIYGDVVNATGYLAGIQIGYNWLVAPGWVAGLEADGSGVRSSGSNTCLQFSPNFIGSNCKANIQAMGTLAGRLGFVTGPAGRTLIYGKAGLAWSYSRIPVQSNSNFIGFTTDEVDTNFLTWGWTVGAGLEHAIAPAWSMKFEYNYLSFSDHDVNTPASVVIDSGTGAVTSAIARTTANSRSDAYVFKVGLNYKWGADPWAAWPTDTQVLPGRPAFLKAPSPEPSWAPGWDVEFGARYWFSSGKYQWDNFFVPDVAESRLTYGRLTNHSGEAFGRVDTPANVFVKGFVGAGSITGGRMNDEDWGLVEPAAFTGYTNTLSDPVKGPISYATADVGFNVMRGPGYKAGIFVGYNYFREELNAYACTQTANPASGICFPPQPSSTLIISQAAKWQSLRVGYSGEVMLTDHIRLGADLAYLPYVEFDGRDDHWLRSGTFFTQGSRGGQGVQTELLISYLFSSNFTLGVGARYWAMWTDEGHFRCTGCGPDDATAPPNPSKNRTERYGVFFQGSYRFDTSGVLAKN